MFIEMDVQRKNSSNDTRKIGDEYLLHGPTFSKPGRTPAKHVDFSGSVATSEIFYYFVAQEKKDSHVGKI